IADLDPKLPLADLQPMTAFVDKSMAPTRFAVLLIAIFAAVAVALAAVGLFGGLSTIVRQRTAGNGIGLGLGASRRGILTLMLGEGLRLSAVGIVAGLFGAWAVGGLMRSMLINVAPTDPATYLAMTALFLGIVGGASWLPARRAARLDPSAAL